MVIHLFHKSYVNTLGQREKNPSIYPPKYYSTYKYPNGRKAPKTTLIYINKPFSMYTKH